MRRLEDDDLQPNAAIVRPPQEGHYVDRPPPDADTGRGPGQISGETECKVAEREERFDCLLSLGKKHIERIINCILSEISRRGTKIVPTSAAKTTSSERRTGPATSHRYARQVHILCASFPKS